MISPTSAADGDNISTSMTYDWAVRLEGASWREGQLTQTLPAANVVKQISATQEYKYLKLPYFYTDPNLVVDKAVGFYITYYWRTGGDYGFNNTDGYYTTGWYAEYLNSDGNRGEIIGGPEVSEFSPVGESGFAHSTGTSLKARYEGSTSAPLTQLWIGNNDYDQYQFKPWGGLLTTVVIPSASLIEVGSLSELDQLENIANGIAQQSQILSAMYGDIMEVLNAIYSRLGDMQATQNLAMSYFNSMVNYLESIDNHTTQIYSLLQSQFQLLIATINTASTDIQGAISQQTEDLKTYFDSVFNSAVGTLPDDTDSAQGVIDDAHENDEQYTADALGKYEEISATFQGFDGSVGSGVAVASTLFSRVWTAMGDYVIVYTFPLTLALALVIVGRLSRVHSKDSSKSKGGDDSG